MDKSLSILATAVRTVGSDDDLKLKDNVINILNGVIGVLSFVAVVVIIIGGVQYMTSSGDATKVKKGKDIILYGVIGLAICVLSFAIVNFVITNIIGDNSDSKEAFINLVKAFFI